MKVNVRTFILIGILLISVALFLFTDARYAALLVVLFTVILGGAALIVGVLGNVVAVKITAPQKGEQGQEEKATLTVSNPGKLPILNCRMMVTAENLLNREKDEFTPELFMLPGKKDFVSFVLKDNHCGLIKLTALKGEIADPLGIFTREIIFEKKSETVCSMYFLPKIQELSISPEDVSTYNMESYKYSQSQTGNDPSEMFDIKEYSEGDSFKAIHWKLSSKMDEIMVREHSMPIENRVLILLDKRPDEEEKDYIDRKIEFTASLSFTLLRKGIFHSLGWFDYLNDQFETVRVDSEESFWMAITELISSPFTNSGKSTARLFAESDAEKEYSNYMYITEDTDSAEILMKYGQIDLFGQEDF